MKTLWKKRNVVEMKGISGKCEKNDDLIEI